MSLSPILQGVIVGGLLAFLAQLFSDWLRRRHETRHQKRTALERALEEVANIQELATVAYLGSDWTDKQSEPVVLLPPYTLTAIIHVWCPNLRDVQNDLTESISVFRSAYADSWVGTEDSSEQRFEQDRIRLESAYERLQRDVAGYYEMAAIEAHGLRSLVFSGAWSAILGRFHRWRRSKRS